MKKFIYIAAAVAALVGCSKSEFVEKTAEGTDNLKVSVNVATEDSDATKAVYDGERYVKFEKNDKIYAAIAKKSTPTKAIWVAKKDKQEKDDYNGVYYSTLTIDDETAEAPSFSGSFFSINKDDKEDEYAFYGVFPGEALNYLWSEEDLTSWRVKLPTEQAATQTSWYNKADVMLLKPSVLVNKPTEMYTWGEFNSINEGETVTMAHLFGFGKITFAGVPAEYASSKVSSVKIEAVGADKVLAGEFYVDVTAPIDEVKYDHVNNKSAVITLPADGTVAVSDYVAWFVAKPGNYDVKITVATEKCDLVFEREGLEIVRSELAAPVVNFKSTDTVVSYDITLENGENWSQKTFSYSYAISSSYKTREWGEGAKKMKFTLDYPKQTNSNYGSYASGVSGYVQLMAQNTLTGGYAVLKSLYNFIGVKNVKVGVGIYTPGVVCDFTVNLVDGETVTKLGTYAVTGTSATPAGQNFWFEVPEGASGKGVLEVVADNFRGTATDPAANPASCRPYISILEVNAAPGIVLDENSVTFEKTASTHNVYCSVVAATADPTVEVSTDAQSWLTASYNNGEVVLTAAENTGAKRTATVTVKATGIGTAQETISVTQKSATAVEYKLDIKPADFLPFVDAKKAELTAAGTTWGDLDGFSVDATFTATATDGSGKTLDVKFSCVDLVLNKCTETQTRIKKHGYDKGVMAPVTELGPIVSCVVKSEIKSSESSYADFGIAVSKDGNSFKNQVADITGPSYDGTFENPCVNTWIPDTDEYTWIQFVADKAFNFYGFEIVFVVD